MSSKRVNLICLVLLCLIGVSPAAVPDPDVGWWKFDEGTGDITADSSGKGHAGTIQGATWVDGWTNSTGSLVGYLEAREGTFVAHATLEQGLAQIISFTEDMPRRGFTVSARVLFSGLVPATNRIAEQLRLEPGEELAHLQRLRLADGEPMCIEHSYFVHKYCLGILDYDFSVRSPREVKIHKYGIRWTYARQTIQAINASQKVADLLGIRRGEALLFFERVSFSQDNIPVEFLQAY